MAGLNDFAVNVDAEETGVWVKVNKMSFLIARAGNDKFKAEQKKLEKQSYGAMARRKDKRNDERDIEIMMECVAKACVLDWKDVELDGKEVKYSEKKCIEIMTDKRFKPLASILIDFATDEERYLEEQIKEDEEEVKK